jgi:hypothetical protein
MGKVRGRSGERLTGAAEMEENFISNQFLGEI